MKKAHVKTQFGYLELVESEKGISEIHFKRRVAKPHRPNTENLKLASQQLQNFCKDPSQELSFKIDPVGTDFQKRVWQQMRKIPQGKTTSYGQLAAKVGCPGGARAVGSACGKNPLLLVIPCHRVLGAQGALGGFSGGLWLKKELLRHEGHSF